MSYLHCHTCYWSQDDFWSKNYNPITWIETNYTKELLEGDLDKLITLDRYNEKSGSYHETLTNREFIARLLESHAKTIRKMKYRTLGEFKADDNPECPGCGERNWDID